MLRRFHHHFVSIFFVLFVIGCSSGSPEAQSKTGSPDRQTTSTVDPVTQALNNGYPVAEMTTSMGTITLALYADKAPKTVENFIRYASNGFYTNTLFHRVIAGFMIQGGGFDTNFQQKPTEAPIKNEANNGLHNVISTIAMARTNDPDSATSQFFINTALNSNLDYSSSNYGYAVFGKVIKGMDTVKKIEYTPTGQRGWYRDVPQTNVVIQSVTIIMPESSSAPAEQ